MGVDETMYNNGQLRQVQWPGRSHSGEESINWKGAGNLLTERTTSVGPCTWPHKARSEALAPPAVKVFTLEENTHDSVQQIYVLSTARGVPSVVDRRCMCSPQRFKTG